jgi:hypothetical protein
LAIRFRFVKEEKEEDTHWYHRLLSPSTASQPTLGARQNRESTARVELKTNERNRIDTRSGLAVGR